MLRAGILGAGTMGKFHSASYSKIPEVKVAGFFDINQEKAKALAKNYDAKIYPTAEELINDSEIDFIDICVPTPFHKQYVLACANAKKHVICEKPIALTVEDAVEMVSACKKANIKFMVGHVLRYFHEYIKIKEIIESGRIGKVGVVRCSRCSGHPRGWEDWYAKPELSGGLILDMLIHDIDFLIWCFGKPERVYTHALTFKEKKPNLIDYCLILMYFKNKVIAHIEGSWAYPRGTFFTTFEATGTDGLIEFDSRKSVPLSLSLTQTAENQMAGVSVPESPVLESPYLLELKNFVNYLLEKEKPKVTPEEAVLALKVTLSALDSAKTGKVISLKY